MKICTLRIRNYRTIETLNLSLPGFYSALSGKNNSGKTNVVRVVRSFFEEEDSNPFIEDTSVNLKSDLPTWKAGDDTINFEIDVLIDATLDAGLHRFLSAFLGLPEGQSELKLTLRQSFGKASSANLISMACNGNEVSEQFKVEEVFKKLRSSKCLLFHNSTQPSHHYLYRRNFGRLFGELTNDEGEQLKKANQKLIDIFKKSAQRHQRDILELLGRLEEKYQVTLSVPPLEMESVPFTVSLGDKKSTVPLDEWGSGTQNRTLILLNLLRAKRSRENARESDRITPILVIEEPECFLHPSAQAEFGKMLQDLADEFQVQVVTTTHSPYMLSLANPAANILLRRKPEKDRQLGTEVVETGGENWMEPFGLALGIDNDAFANWRNVLFKKANQIILVEGETDKAYLEMLRDSSHGSDALNFDGEIFPYGGTGFFSNTILIRFVMSRFSRFIITYDLDHDASITKSLNALNLKKGQHYLPIGIDRPGKRDIEGLLPDSVRSAVYSGSTELVAVATSSDKEKDSARGKLKSLLLDEFRRNSSPGDDSFGEFYKLTKILNRIVK